MGRHLTNRELNRYRGSGNRHLENLVAEIERDMPGPFTFPEPPGAEPADNPSERALRYIVVFPQDKRADQGRFQGREARMSNPATCILTWRAQGRIVAEEAAGLI